VNNVRPSARTKSLSRSRPQSRPREHVAHMADQANPSRRHTATCGTRTDARHKIINATTEPQHTLRFETPRTTHLEAPAVQVPPQQLHSPGADAAHQLPHTLLHERHGAQLHSPSTAPRQRLLPEPRLEVRHHHTVHRVPHPSDGLVRTHAAAPSQGPAEIPEKAVDAGRASQAPTTAWMRLQPVIHHVRDQVVRLQIRRAHANAAEVRQHLAQHRRLADARLLRQTRSGDTACTLPARC
jgi:hypothetical protein